MNIPMVVGPNLGLPAYLEGLPQSDVMRVDEPVSRDYTLTAIALELERRGRNPVVVLSDVVGSRLPVVGNLFADPSRYAGMIGASPGGYVEAVVRATRVMVPAEVTSGSAPCHERREVGDEVDLDLLPISRHFSSDGGRYVCSGILVTRDPDTGVRNLSYQRMMITGERSFGISLHSRGHAWDYLRRASARGHDLEAAVIIGAHPAIYLAASARVAMDVDEYDIAGGLVQEPIQLTRCQTVDLDVPCESEIVIEGVIKAGVHEPEGPFGEYTGYSTDRSTNNRFEVSALTHKAQPIYLDLVPGNSGDHLGLGQAVRQPLILARLREVMPQVMDIIYPRSGTIFHAYLQMNKTAEGQAKQALMLLFGLDSYVKLAVAVGPDIDLRREDEVLWSIATRVQADRDIFTVPKVFHNRLDPSGEDGLSAKMGVDATGAPSTLMAPRVRLPDEAVAQARELIDSSDG